MGVSPEQIESGLDFRVDNAEQARRHVDIATAMARIEFVRHALVEFPDAFFPYMERPGGLNGQIFTDITLNRHHKLTLHNDFYDDESNRFMILTRERPGEWNRESWQVNARAGYSEHVVWWGTTTDAECTVSSPRTMVSGSAYSLAAPDYMAKAASASDFVDRVLKRTRKR